MTYQELKELHRKRINDFPICFAFSTKQLADVVTELGPKDTLVSIGSGGIIRADDLDKFNELFELSEREMREAKLNDDLLLEAIEYELGNHEYGYTGDPTSTIDALNLDMDDSRIKRIFAQAREAYLKNTTL